MNLCAETINQSSEGKGVGNERGSFGGWEVIYSLCWLLCILVNIYGQVRVKLEFNEDGLLDSQSGKTVKDGKPFRPSPPLW